MKPSTSLWLAFCVSGSIFCDASIAHATPSPSALQASLHNKLKTIQTYQVNTEILAILPGKAPQVINRCRIWTKRPGTMRATCSITKPGPGGGMTMTLTVLYQGRWQWVKNVYQSKQFRRAQYFKIDRNQTHRPGYPLETGYDLRGSGMNPGRELVGTLQEYLSFMKFHKVTKDTWHKQPVYQVQAVAKKEAFLAYLREKFSRTPMSPATQERFVQMEYKRTKEIHFTLSAKTLLPVRIHQQGDATSPSGVVEFTYISINRPIAASHFRFNAPKGTKIRDITSLVLRQNQRTRRTKPTSRPTSQPTPPQQRKTGKK